MYFELLKTKNFLFYFFIIHIINDVIVESVTFYDTSDFFYLSIWILNFIDVYWTTYFINRFWSIGTSKTKKKTKTRFRHWKWSVKTQKTCSFLDVENQKRASSYIAVSIEVYYSLSCSTYKCLYYLKRLAWRHSRWRHCNSSLQSRVEQ